VTAHANLELVGSPGFNQPRRFRPLVKDDSLEHQIRFLSSHHSNPYVACVCGVWGGVVVEAVHALAWYRTHRGEVDRDVVSRGNVSDVAEGGT
jgi:hypothetical protein